MRSGPLWIDEQLQALAAALDQARSGRTTLLVIEGVAGVGKSTLLDELIQQAPDFRLISAEAWESDQAPFTVLEQWGVVVPPALGGVVQDTFVTAQALRSRLDEVGSAPVLLVLEDLHWADPESVEALNWLLRRSSDDPLLVAVTARPLEAEQYPTIQRWAGGRGHSTRIELSGFAEPEALTLIEQLRPGTDPAVGHQLWEHTSGHPLYLTALLREFEGDELARMRVLPAPAEFARSLNERVKRLPEPAGALLRAASVLGNGWVSLADVAALAELEEPAQAAQGALDSGLIQTREGVGPLQLRLVHALVRAAVYQHIALADKRRLHRRAAEVVTARQAFFEHRMAAADQYDDALAGELEDYSSEFYALASFRLAAQYLLSASALTPDPRMRERRWLEAVFCHVMALDFPSAQAAVADVERATDAPRRALVLGALAAWERRHRDAIALLEPVAAQAGDGDGDGDSRLRYRVEVLLAWSRLCAGHPTKLIADGHAAAAATGVRDPAVDGVGMIVAGLTGIRRVGAADVLQRFSAIPEQASAAPLEATNLLAFRGSTRARAGLLPEAVVDLSEACRRLQEGVTGFGGGSFHAFLAYAQWMRGEWDAARISARLALDITGTYIHPMVSAMVPLVDVGFGRFEDADALIARGEAILTEAPWDEACQVWLTTRVAALHARGVPADQARLWDALRGTAFDPERWPVGPPTLQMHVALAAVWARRPAEAERAVDAMLAAELRAPWLAMVGDWLRGLIAEARGDGRAALQSLTAALAGDGSDIPLYRAHLLADHARVAHLMGQPRAAQESLTQAEQLYRRLGARPYLDRIEGLRKGQSERIESVPAVELTDRERDVLSLVAAGMSYAQVARELFITQRTVGYHLSNIYAKAGVNSRHQLTALVRRDPLRFGLAAVS